MKTFKMLSFHLLLENEVKKIPIIDGIVINLENSHKVWTLELLCANHYYEFFQQLFLSEQPVDANVVISFPENEPAPFLIVVHNITHTNNEISVLFKARLKAQRQQYAEKLLHHLVHTQALEGTALLQAFETNMRIRPKL